VLKSPRAIGYVIVELKTNASENSSISIIRVYPTWMMEMEEIS
jgi:hypothetical protein